MISTTSPTIIEALGVSWTDAQDGYLLVKHDNDSWILWDFGVPSFLAKHSPNFLVADELTNGAWQLLDAVSWFQAGACTAALEVLQLKQRREAASITRFTSESFTCNLVCFMCASSYTFSAETTSSVPLSHVSVEPPVFLAAPSFAISCFSFWPTPSPQYVSWCKFSWQKCFEYLHRFRSLVFVLESVKARNASMAILQLCGPNLCEKEKALLSSPSVVMASILRVCLTMLVLMGADGGPLAYGICQTGCNSLAVACYAAAGATFGTVTAGAGVPAAILACNAALGTCMAACVAAGFCSYSVKHRQEPMEVCKHKTWRVSLWFQRQEDATSQVLCRFDSSSRVCMDLQLCDRKNLWFSAFWAKETARFPKWMLLQTCFAYRQCSRWHPLTLSFFV